jgi:hypothetical protein
MNNGPTLRMGSTGPDVRRLQRVLVEIKLLDFTRIDGDFGSMELSDPKRGRPCRRTGIPRNSLKAAQVRRCQRSKRASRPTLRRTQQQTPALLMACLGHGPQQRCAPIKQIVA